MTPTSEHYTSDAGAAAAHLHATELWMERRLLTNRPRVAAAIGNPVGHHCPMHLTSRAGAMLATIGVAIANGLGMPMAWADKQTHTFVLTQGLPSLRPVELGAPGVSEGDMLLYEATFSGENGESGTLTGLLITADIPDPETGDLDADRLGQLSFDFGNGNSLVALGESTYRAENVEMTANLPQLRAVVGGTGTYMGARGQVATTRNPDGGYRYEFTLIDD